LEKDDRYFKANNGNSTSWTNRSNYADSAPSIKAGYVGSSHASLKSGNAVPLQSPPLNFCAGKIHWITRKGGIKMNNLMKYLVIHVDPNIPWEKVEENWAKLANVKNATWIRTCYNKAKGVRYCVWLAPSEDVLETIFKQLDISYESIIEVEETVPDLWGKKWQEHLKAEETADTLGF
jgi:hypothetical protein